ncbi:MAG: ATP-binding protein [Eggerthella lenta]
MRVDWGGQTASPCRCRVEEADRSMPRAGPRPSGPWRAAFAQALPPDPGHEFGLQGATTGGFRIVREYARHWQMAEGGHGLVLIGPPGTGKTFAAGCLANS